MRLTIRLLALTLLASATTAGAQNDVYDPATYQALKYRMIGPHKGSRVTAVAGIAEQPWTYFMGTNGGGIYKTVDGGDTWTELTNGLDELPITVGSWAPAACQTISPRFRSKAVMAEPRPG